MSVGLFEFLVPPLVLDRLPRCPIWESEGFYACLGARIEMSSPSMVCASATASISVSKS